LSFLILAGCANTFIDLVRAKANGEGMGRVYKVDRDRAWEVAKRIMQWEGIGEIEENESEDICSLRAAQTGILKGPW